MRILIVSQHFWPESFLITEVAQSLRDLGHQVSVLTGQPNYPKGEIYQGYSAASLRSQVYDGVRILRVPLVPRGERSAARLAANYVSFVLSASIFGPWLARGVDFDAILVFGTSPILQAIPAIWLRWIKAAKLAIWVQDIWPDSLSATGFVHNRRILKAVSKVVRWIYRNSDLLLVQSEAFVDPVTRLAGETPVVFHPNPGPREFSNPIANPKPALRLPNKFTVVFAGNLGTVQALDTVLSAASLLRNEHDVQIVLIGDGSRSEWLRRESKRLELSNLSMPGRFSSSEIPGILAQASALLVCLVRDPAMNVTIPTKLQAYLALGKPVIASLDGEGARVLIEAGAGVTCPAEDANALAAAITHLRDANPEERIQMANRGRAYYREHFEPDMLAKRLTALLSAMTGTQSLQF